MYYSENQTIYEILSFDPDILINETEFNFPNYQESIGFCAEICIETRSTISLTSFPPQTAVFVYYDYYFVLFDSDLYIQEIWYIYRQ